MTECTHRKVTTYVFVDGNEPTGLWACADCGHKFVPLNIAVEKDAERYRWLRDSERIPNDDSGDGHIVVCSGGGEDVLWGAAMDAAIDHDMRAVG